MEQDKSVDQVKEPINNESFENVFSSLIIDQLNSQDVSKVLQTQRQILLKLDATNKNMAKVNRDSGNTYNNYALRDFQSYAATLHQMKQDLDYIFKRIRTIKAKLKLKYPHNYSNAVNKMSSNEFEDDSFEQEKPTSEESKPRSSTNESNEGSTSSVLNEIIQTARERINSTGFIASIYNSTPHTQTDQDLPADN